MPVTAKLSRRFYEQFGDDLANELVDWFNAVDATYRSDHRELNERNFARFDAKLEQRFAGQETEWDRRLAHLEAQIEQRFAQQDSKSDRRFADHELRLERGLAEFRTALQSLKVDVVRWLFAFWTSTLIALAAFLLAVLRSR